MASGYNKHGLSRNIPADVKRAVRQRCGFGCVVCGFGLYQYEHFDPDFADAKWHNPAGITLLCGTCHDHVTRGIWSKSRIARENGDPRCKRDGFARGFFDTTGPTLTVSMGGVLFTGVEVPIRVDEVALLEIRPPEQPNAPWRLSARFCRQSGGESLRIVENEWVGATDSWDIEQKGPTLTIRDAPGRLGLRITAIPPSLIMVDRLAMNYRGVSLAIGTDNVLQVRTPNGVLTRMDKVAMDGLSEGVAVTSDGRCQFARAGANGPGVMKIGHLSIVVEK